MKVYLFLLPLLALSAFATQAERPEVVRANYRKHLQKLFPQGPKFCNPNSDIRIVLLGQAWIKYEDTNLTYPGVKELLDFLKELDATVLFSNIETAINGSYAIANNATIINPINTHVSPPAVIDILQKNYSTNVLSTSNNHNSDIGPAGTISGILEIQQRNLKFTGSGYNATQALEPAYLPFKNNKKIIGVMGVVSSPLLSVYGGIANATSAGVNTMQLINNRTIPDPVARANNLAKSNEACRKADLVIQYHHNHFFNDTWGIDQWWKNFAHDTIDNGASLYLSQGAQNIRGIEIYKGNLAIYSNGNLYFQGLVEHEPVEEQEGFIVDACFDGKTTALKAARVIPTILTNGSGAFLSPEWHQTHGLPTLSSGAQALSTLTLLKNLSAALGTNIIIDTQNLVGTINLTGRPVIPPNCSLNCKRNKDLGTSGSSSSNGNSNSNGGNFRDSEWGRFFVKTQSSDASSLTYGPLVTILTFTVLTLASVL